MPEPVGMIRLATYAGGMVELWRERRGTAYSIVYGLELKGPMDRDAAADTLGQCLFHWTEGEDELGGSN